MARKKVLFRNYAFPDSVLKKKSDVIAICILRDIAEFNLKEVTTTTVTNFKNMAEEFDNYPTDEEVEGAMVGTTEDKSNKRNLLLVACSTIRTMAQNKWGVKKAEYRIYGLNKMSEIQDEKLHRCAKRIARVATRQLAALASEGLTMAVINNLIALTNQFDESIDNQEDAILERDIATQTRIEKGNELHKELSRLCNIGKDIWYSTNEAKYNDYLIYDSAE